MKKLLALALSLSMILGCMAGITLTVSAETLAGDGTEASPFIIDTAEKFAEIFSNGSTADLTKVYLVTGFDVTPMDLPSTYMADTVNKFSGKLLGGNLVNGEIVPVVQKINFGTYTTSATNITGDTASSSFQGVLFNEIAGATISHFELSGTVTVPEIKNCAFGVVVGRISSAGKVLNVTNCADVTGRTWSSSSALAGLVGSMASGQVVNCSNYGDITQTKTYSYQCAGIVGKISKGVTIKKCFNYGTITSLCEAAGIVGWSAENTINQVGNFGKINTTTDKNGAYWEAAGILGRAGANITINDSFNVGEIVAVSYAGPFVGINEKYTVTVNNCFNAGTVDATTAPGLIEGKTGGSSVTVVNGFYDIANPEIASVTGVAGTGTFTVTNAFGIGNTETTPANDVAKTSLANILALTETNEVFSNTDNWIKSEGFVYPNIAKNPYPNPYLGSGTEDAPYKIYTLEELKNVSLYPTAHYVLMNDISGMDEMIGVETPFSGVFDGNGKTIEVNIDTTEATEHPKYAGLFCQAKGTIKNLNVDGTVEAGFVDYTGGTAGIVGKAQDGLKIDNCNNYADVTSLGHHSAGIVGNNNAGMLEITNCTNYGDIYGGEKAAGIVGVIASSSKIQKCGNYGNVTGGTHAAGICEWTYTWQWLDSNFNVGTITATSNDGIAAGLYADMVTTANGKNIQYNLNAGNLYADNTYGIAQINDGSKKLTIKNSYNLVYADYPVFNKTESNPTAYADLFYISDSETDEVSETTAVSKDTLKAKTITGMAKSGNYSYPQPTANKLDTDKDSIEVSKVTLTNETENVNVTIDTYPVGSFYVANGGFVTVKADANDFYEVLVNGEKVEDKAVVTVNGDISVAVTENKIEYVVPDSLGNTVYAFTSDEKGTITLRDQEYSRYSLIFSKAAPAPGLKRTEFGMFFGTDENISEDNYKEKVVAESQRISNDGTYGVLFYSNEGSNGLADGTAYYVLPYAVFEDAEGNEYVVTGTTQSFIFGE